MPLIPVEDLESLDLSDEATFKDFRAAVRSRLLAQILIGASDEREIVQTFSGSGDSGDWESRHNDPYVQHLFDHLLEEKVTFDWSNNEGGGGSITWDLDKDLITIETYWNETVQNDQPTITLDADGNDPNELEAA